MNKFLRSIKSVLKQLAYAASYGVQSSLHFWIFIELISCFQTMHIILRTSLAPNQTNEAIILDYIKSLTSLICLIDMWDLFQRRELILLAFLLIISIYLATYLVFMFLSVIITAKKEKSHEKLLELCTQVNIIHSRVLFYPIHYFLLNLINWQQECQTDDSFVCNLGLNILAFFLLVINLITAGLKEVLFYQIYNTKNVFAMKTNLHTIIQFSHKALLLPLLVFQEQAHTPNSILNFLLTLTSHLIMFIRLPLFNVKCLKMTVILSSICTTSSFILMWNVFITGNAKIFEALIIFIVLVMSKVMQQILNNIFKRILNLKAISPEYIVHLPILLNYYNYHPKRFGESRVFRYKELFNLVFLRRANIEISNPINLKQIKESKNILILRELIKCYQSNPKSRTVLLYLVKFYLEKTKNIYQAITYIQKVKELSLSLSNESALVYINRHIQKMLSQSSKEDHQSLDFSNYFKYQESSIVLKQSIHAEVGKHIEFWKSFSKDKVNVYKVLQTSKKLETLASQNHKFWKQNAKDFMKHFPISLIMYRVYQYLTRNTENFDFSIIDRTFEQNCKASTESVEKWFSQEDAIIVASNQKGMIGKVLDASYSVKNLFNIEKQDLIGRKVNLLMPRMIQEKHDVLVQRYTESAMNIKNRNVSVYCKTIDGYFFPANFTLKVYPYIEKEVGLVGMFRKKNEEKPMSIMFVDVNGTIVDCSRDLLAMFNLNLQTETSIQDIAPDFDKINKAFNASYLSELDSLSPEGKQSIDNTKRYPLRTENGTIEGMKRTFLSEASQIGFRNVPFLDRNLFSTNLKNSKQVEYTLTSPTSPKEKDFLLESLPNRLMDTLSPKKKWEQLNTNVFSFNDPVPMSKAEYEKICQEFKDGNTVLFYSSLSAQEDNKQSYFVKIEPLFFENKFYKIVKLKKVENNNPNLQETSFPKIVSQKILKPVANILESGSDFSVKQSAIQRILSSKTPQKFLGFESDPSFVETDKSLEKVIGTKEALSLATVGTREVRKEFASNNNGRDVESERKRLIKNTFVEFFKNHTTSTLMKIYYLIFYFAMVLMVSLAVVDYKTIRVSFKQVELGTRLVNLNSERLAYLFQTWSACNAMFTFHSSGRPYPTAVFSPTYVKDQTQIISQVERSLVKLLEQVDSEDVVKTFYTRNIYFWDPSTNEQAGYSPIDVFTGSHLVLQNLAIMTNENMNLIRSNPGLIKFGLNNTVNDLFLSAENELRVTQRFKRDIYTNNILMLKVLISVHTMSIFIILISLLILLVWMIKAHQRLFRALSTIPIELMQKREKELVRFQNFLRGNLESTQFVQDLNSLVYENSRQVKEQEYGRRTVFKEENKFIYTEFKLKVLCIFGVSLVLFIFIYCLFFLSNTQARQNIDKLEQIDGASKIAETTGYQTYLISANFMYFMSFYNQTSMLLRNESPLKQLEKHLKNILDTNSLLTSTFSGQQKKLYDPDIEKFLLRDVCSFIDQNTRDQAACKNGTKGGTIGFIGLNLQLYDFVSSSLDRFKADPTLTNYFRIVATYVDQAKNFVIPSDKGFRFLRTRLLNTLLANVEEQNKTSTKFLIGIFIACFFVGVLMRFIVLNFLNTIDNLRFKVVKLVPQDMILGNKGLLFYLKREFPKDFAEIKSVL